METRNNFFMKHLEYDLQKQVCKYLSLQYPEVLFLSDSVAFVELTMPQATRNKAIQKNGFKCPYLIILEPKNHYNGLFIKLKVKSPYKKDGELLKNDHLEGQANTILKLIKKGYCAQFATGFDRAKELIDNYMNL